jgi:hypothetical protein
MSIYCNPRGTQLKAGTTGDRQMARKQKTWGYFPKKPPKPKVPDQIKAEVAHAAEKLISGELRPTHVKPPPQEDQFNYVVDIFTKWHGNYFYFSAKYACPGPNALSPFFDAKFARIEYAGDKRFHLSYMRHTGQWVELYRDLPFGECLERIGQEPYFHP